MVYGEVHHVPMVSEFLMDPALVNSERMHIDPRAGTYVIKEHGWT
jgi:hypothetical protein